MVDVPWQRPARVLAFGDSNTWGFTARPGDGVPTRLTDEARWAGVLQSALGAEAKVLVDAVSGRRSDLDADDEPGGDAPAATRVAGSAFNGLAHAEAAGMAHAPLDLVIVMLGTNDLPVTPPRTAEHIAGACVRVAQALVRGAIEFTPGRNPAVLLVSPPVLGGDGGPREGLPAWPRLWQASRALAPALAQAAGQAGMAFFDADAGARGATDLRGPDGVHLSAAGHERLGLALAPPVRALLGLPPPPQR